MGARAEIGVEGGKGRLLGLVCMAEREERGLVDSCRLPHGRKQRKKEKKINGTDLR